jgi:hypothetical protein
MPKKGSIKTNSVERIMNVYTKPTGEFRVELTRSNRETADAIWAALPFESKTERWGDEIYFKIPVKFGEENTQTVVKIGDVAYWPPGESMCIFFGPTPVSEADEPRAYSPVSVFGKVIGEPMVLKKIGSGEKIRVGREE